MLLKDIPAGSKFRVNSMPYRWFYKFYNVDNEKSFCENEIGEILHIDNTTEVEMIND